MAVLTLGLMFSCRDESLNPTLEPEFGAYGKGQFIVPVTNDELPTTFGAYSQSAVNAVIFWDKANTNEVSATTNVKAQVFWNAGKESVVVSKIELYATFSESYLDKNGNVVTRNHGAAASPTVPQGNLFATIDAGARFTPATFTVDPKAVYNVFKGIKFAYDGTNAVDIFEANPGGSRTVNRFLPSRPHPTVAGKILGTDNIVVRWRLLAADGRSFGSWHNNTCTQLKDANCSVAFTVK